MARGDAALTARLQAGDTDAPGQLLASYQAKLQALAFRLLRNREDAEEVTQDALVRAVRKAHLFRGEAALSTWLYSLTFNAAMSRLRRDRTARRATASREFIDVALSFEDGRRVSEMLVDREHVPDRQHERAGLRRAYARAVRELAPEYRRAIMDVDVRGHGLAEAATLEAVPVGTLKSRLHRARRKVRADVAALRPGHD